MFTLCANKNRLTVLRRELITNGSVNVYPVRFEFSTDWKGLNKTAVFRAGTESCAAALSESGVCTVPREVLEKAKTHLFCGIYVTQGSHTVLPTIWADLGEIQPGAIPGENAQPSPRNCGNKSWPESRTNSPEINMEM